MSEEPTKIVNEKELNEELEITEEGKIYIKNIAFKKMISHVLKYGNEVLEESYEVLGACIGAFNTDKNTINLMDVVPVTHGDIVELGFSKEIHDTFKEIDNKNIDQNLSVLGYYLSHTGYGVSLSSSDKKNLLYFQDEKNPFGFGIIFDYSLMGKENNFGLQIYRLKNYSKGTDSEIFKVSYEIEKPNTLDYFRWIKNLIEDSQKKTPVIVEEYSESKKPLPEELQEIPLTEKEILESGQLDFNSQITPIYSGLQNGTAKFSELIIDTYRNQLNNWMWDVTQGTLKGTEYIRSSITQMKNTIASGLEDVQNYFERSFNEISDVFIKDISEYIDKRISNQKEVKEDIQVTLKNISDNSKKILEENFNRIINKLEENEISIDKKLIDITKTYDKMEPLLNQFSEKLTTAYNETNTLSESLIKDIELLATRFETKLKMEITDLNMNSDPIKEKYEEMEILIERLQKVISNFRQLK